jgi:hypothetical protein
MKKPKTRILRVNIHKKHAWLVACLDLGDREDELCRMVSPPYGAHFRVELVEAFEALASKILESIVRDEHPDAHFTTKVIRSAKQGHG